MFNYYKASPGQPFHLSVGAVAIDDAGKVFCHYWRQKSKFKNVYSLMHETIEMGESIDGAVYRGLIEEFGVSGEITSYLGSIVATDEWFGEISRPTIVEKTTIYFLVKHSSFSTSERLKDDWEGDSDIVLMDIDDLILKMDKLAADTGLNYFDESKILKAAKKVFDFK